MRSFRRLILVSISLTVLLGGSRRAEAELPRVVRRAAYAVAEACLRGVVAAANLRPTITVKRDRSLLADFNQTGIIEDLIRRFPELAKKRSYLRSLNRMSKKEGVYSLARTQPAMGSFSPFVALDIYTDGSGWGVPFILQLEPHGAMVGVHSAQKYFEWGARQVGIDLQIINYREVDRDYHPNGLTINFAPGASVAKAVAVLEIVDKLILPPDYMENHVRNVRGLLHYPDPESPSNLIGKLSLNYTDVVEAEGAAYYTARIRDSEFFRALKEVRVRGRINTDDYEVISAEIDRVLLRHYRGEVEMRYHRLDSPENEEGWLWAFNVVAPPR